MTLKDNIASIRGMHDITPANTLKWQRLENTLIETAKAFGYKEIRTPIVENSNLFKRSIGQETDIVNKEMYSFQDKNGDELTLRPEGTASCVRAMAQHSLLRSPGQKIWYLGPMFRHERPQRGRTRQFHQFGLETFGITQASIELELLSYCTLIWEKLGIADKVQLEINCLGSDECRATYKKELIKYFKQHKDKLSEEELKRLELNTLRILDSKNPVIIDLLPNAPKLSEYLNNEQQQHFKAITEGLKQLDIKYAVNPYLVRGLDYYSGTVFEITTSELGAQGTICAGGRYDNLVSKLSNNSMAATGFAMGLERILELMPEPQENKADIYVIAIDEKSQATANIITHRIRRELKQTCLLDHIQSNIKNKFKRAAASSAKIALVLGQDECENNTVTIKYLDDDKKQQCINNADIIDFIQTIFGDNNE